MKGKKQLLLGRDRLGVKPLYWYLNNGVFLFASELKAFFEHPQFDPTIDQDSVATYLAYGYIPADKSIFKYVKKVSPGTFLIVDRLLQPKIETYWSAVEQFEETSLIAADENEAVERLESELVESIRLRLVADVPVGIFLSGGVDSSLVTAIGQKCTNQQLKTFTIGFDDPEINESEHAKRVAQQVGTDHHELICTEADFLAIVPRIPEIADEPLGDASIIPTYLVAKFAREHVKVSLSADGGDEIFGGYTKYEFVKKWFPRLSNVPLTVRKPMSHFLVGLLKNSFCRRLIRLRLQKGYSNVDAKMYKLSRSLQAHTMADLFSAASRYLSSAESFQLLGSRATHDNSGLPIESDDGRIMSSLGLMDICHYLEGDILPKVDRATMAVALEGRDPLLDHQLVRFGFSLPDPMKIQGTKNKYLLRKVLDKYVPQFADQSIKRGFTIPVAKWLRKHFDEQLRAMCANHDFSDSFAIDNGQLSVIVDGFLSDRGTHDPMLVWFLFTLHQWQQKWLRR